MEEIEILAALEGGSGLWTRMLDVEQEHDENCRSFLLFLVFSNFFPSLFLPLIFFCFFFLFFFFFFSHSVTISFLLVCSVFSISFFSFRRSYSFSYCLPPPLLVLLP